MCGLTTALCGGSGGSDSRRRPDFRKRSAQHAALSETMTAADRRGSTASNTSGIHPAPPAAAAGGSGGRRSSTGGPGGPGAARGPNGSVLADLAARGELKAADGSTAAANAGPFAPRRFPTNADVVRAVHARAEVRGGRRRRKRSGRTAPGCFCAACLPPPPMSAATAPQPRLFLPPSLSLSPAPSFHAAAPLSPTQQAAELCRAYRAAAAYVLFVALYMAALYAQAAAFGAAPAVGALRRALLDDPSRPALAFASGAQVLAYLGNRVVRPAWTDPVCGDGRCERPWEFPAWGPFGCRADCGAEPRTARVVVAATADFTGHALLGARALMAAARWNLCLDDGARRARGDADLCW